MGRFQRIAAVLLIAAAAGAAPATAAADVPDYQRVIKARTADAALLASAGCLRTEVFASSSDSVFGGRPGPVNKQGLTGVLVVTTDTCAVPLAAGPPQGNVVFTGIGQTLDPLRTTARFDGAWIDVTVPVLDEVSGRTVPVRLALRWTPRGAFQRDTSHTHVRVPHGAIVNSHTQTLMADAAVSGSVTIGTRRIAFGPTEGAHLQQVKYGCQVVPHPRGSADLDC